MGEPFSQRDFAGMINHLLEHLPKSETGKLHRGKVKYLMIWDHLQATTQQPAMARRRRTESSAAR